MIASMIVVEVDTAVAATTIITVDPLAMMIVSVVRTDVVMTMALVVLIVMRHQAAKIAIAAVEMIAVVAMTTIVEMVDVLTLGMVTLHRQETAGISMVEVEPLTTALTIGTPVDRLLSAKSTQVRSALPNKSPKPVSCSRAKD